MAIAEPSLGSTKPHVLADATTDIDDLDRRRPWLAYAGSGPRYRFTAAKDSRTSGR
ncbi:hypothetical protein ACWIGI_25190 [Nocardia sp. NPDC055321]